MIEIILTSSVLILLLVILRRALRGRISPCVQYALWLLVAARLLIPGTLFHAPVSVLGAAEGLQTSLHETFPDPDDLPEPPINAIISQLPQQEVIPAIPSGTVYPDDDVAVSYQGIPSEITQRVYNWPDIIWKTGMAVTVGALVLSNLIFYLRLRKGRKRLALPETLWSGELPVYEMEALASPCLFGFFRPAIYLNRAAMEAEHPEHILAHEYAHYRHGDHVWAILRSVCLAIHWYNPLVWWAAALSRRDCELACDASALWRLGEDARIDYGQTLLGMVSRSRNPAALLHTATTMTAGKKAMKERIALIIKQPRMKKITLVLVALVVCGAVAVTFGGKAVAVETESNPGEDAAAVQPESGPGEAPAAAQPEVPNQAALAATARSIVEQVQSGTDVGGWLPLMSYMDWGILRQAAVEAGMDEGDGSGTAVEIISVIDHYVERQGGSVTMAEYLYILSATAGLDGAVTEGYAYTIHRMYILDPGKFAYVVLEQLPEEQRDVVLLLFCSEWYYDQFSSWDRPTREEALAQLEADLAAYITASPSEMILRSAGSTFQFQLLNAPGIYALTYTSSDTGVAVVDDNGVVTAVGPGEAVITMHYEGAGGPQDFECRVRCEWEETPADGDASVIYADEIAEWEQWFQSYMDSLSAAPEGEIIYDCMDERSLYGRTHAYLYRYASDHFGADFARNCYDYDVQLGFSVPNELTQPQLTMAMQYYVIVFAAIQLPNGELHSLQLTSRELTTTLTITEQMNMMMQMLVEGASGNLPWTGEAEPSSETINEWQRAFFGFVFELPAMPDQELAYDGQTENGLEQAVLSALEAYYRSYVAEHGNSAHNDRFSRIILESEIPAYAEYKERITVTYQVECQSEREWNGVTYPVAPQAGDHLSTTFTVYRLGGTLSAGPQMPHNASYICSLPSGTAAGAENWNLEYIRRDIQARTESRMQSDTDLHQWSITSVELTEDGDLTAQIAPGDTAEVQYNLILTYNGASGYNTSIGPLSVTYTFSE